MIVKRIKDTEIRRYRTNDGKLLGMAGPVEELERLDILQYTGKGIETRAPAGTWCCITADGSILDFVDSKAAAKLVFMELDV